MNAVGLSVPMPATGPAGPAALDVERKALETQRALAESLVAQLQPGTAVDPGHAGSGLDTYA